MSAILIGSISCKNQENYFNDKLSNEFKSSTNNINFIPTKYPHPKRLVSIGDLHGDLQATKKAFRIAGATDENDNWIGKDLVIVQTGDQLDRGDDEIAILDFLAKIEIEAEKVGGKVHVLNGNHEFMNVDSDLRYITKKGFTDFIGMKGLDIGNPKLKSIHENMRYRAAAFIPGSKYAKLFSKRNTIVIVGDTIFAHGGVLPVHVKYGLEKLNEEIRQWLLGKSKKPEILNDFENSPVWSRHYSYETDENDCQLLRETLETLKLKRMVVGHTVQQKGISTDCGDLVYKVDVGMSKHYGGSPEVLEISGDKVKVIR